MNRQSSNQNAWAAHFVLALAMCLWLYLAHNLNVSFNKTMLVAVAITLSGGIVTSIRANGLVRRGRQQLAAAREYAQKRDAEYSRLIYSIPVLYSAFATVFPHKARGKFTLHELASWILGTLQEPNVNLMDWVMRRPDAAGMLPALHGIYGHIPEAQRKGAFDAVNRNTAQAFGDMVIVYETDPLFVAPAQSDDESQRGRHRVPREPQPV